MNDYTIRQLRFVRNLIIEQIKEMNENASLFIPKGFNNNIKWNLGHIYIIQERFAFSYIGEKMSIPDNFAELFSTGTKPAEWGNLTTPTMDELTLLLSNQVDRVEKTLKLRLKEPLEHPHTTSSGLTLSTVEELLGFCLYHEAMHLDAIKSIKRIMQFEG